MVSMGESLLPSTVATLGQSTQNSLTKFGGVLTRLHTGIDFHSSKVALMGLYSQYSVRFERGKVFGESRKSHHHTVALVGPSLQAMPLS